MAKKKKANKTSKLSKVLNSVNTTARGTNKYTRKLSPKEISNEVRRAYFLNLSPQEILLNVSKVASHSDFVDSINLTLSDTYNHTYNFLIPPSSLDLSLNWSLGIILHHKDILNKFIELEYEVTKFITLEKYNEALLFLDKIDSLCGISSWSISVRGSILDIENKYNKSQEFLKDLINKSDGNSFFNAVCRNVISRYDNSSLHISSAATLRNQIIRTMQEELQHFLMYKIVPRDFSYDYKIDYLHILNYEKNSSIIDIFKAVINFLSSSLDTKDVHVEASAKYAVNKLSPHFNYYVLDGLSAYYGVVPKWTHKISEYKMIDAYSAGEYDLVCSIASENADEYINFTMFELICKSAARTGDDLFTGLKNTILHHLVNIFLKNDDYQKSLTEIFSICHAFSGIPWFQELHFLVSRESGFIDDSSNEYLMLLSSVYSEVNSPRKSESLPFKYREQYIQSCEAAIKESLSIRLFEILLSEDFKAFDDEGFNKLDRNRLLKYKAKLFIRVGLVDDAVDLLEKLITCNDRIVSYDATWLLVDSYIDTGKGEEALKLFVSSSLENNNVVLRFNTHKICDVSEVLIKKSKSISVPISLSLHSRLVNSNYDSALRYSFEMFLSYYDLSDPIEVIGLIGQIREYEVDYFLQYVCIPEVMKLSFLFENDESIENCRINVCKYLIDKNISKERLVNEVKKITRDQVIRKAVNHVEHSKIYADTNALEDNRSQTYRDVFEHYLELTSNDYSSYEDEKTFQKIFSEIDYELLISSAQSIHILELTLNEKNSTFHKLIGMVRDEFTFGSKGLNSYLSTRIRHGVLPNTIRGCVSSENLVTAIHSDKNIPKSNLYWKKQLSLESGNDWNNIDKFLNKFTIEFEKIINEVNDEWLQIVSLDNDIKNLQEGGDKNKALFDYSISTLETYILQKAIEEDEYDEFIKVTLNWLWRRTEYNLESVRRKLSSDASERFSNCYSDLLEGINKSVSNSEEKSKIHDAIFRSKASLSVTLNSIVTWFSRVEVDEVKEFAFSTAIDIAVRSSTININVENDDTILYKGEYLTNFVDILYILFENAATKSNLPKDELNVNISLEVNQSGSLIINVKNNCKTPEDFNMENKKLDYYRDAYGNEELINEVVQQEGGTGIFKIWKILSKDIEIEHDVDFKYEEDNLFSFKITLYNSNRIECNENTDN